MTRKKRKYTRPGAVFSIFFTTSELREPRRP